MANAFYELTMALFTRDRSADVKVLQGRIQRLLAEFDGLVGVDDRVRRERNRNDAWVLMFDAGKELQSSYVAMQPRVHRATSLQSLWETDRDRIRTLASVALAAAKISFIYEMAARNWLRATIAGKIIPLAVTAMDEPGLDITGRRNISAFIKRIPELAAYACHRAGLPQAAPNILEAVTSLTLDDRMMHRSAQAYAHRPTAQSDLQRVLRQLRGLISDYPITPMPQTYAAKGTRKPFDEFALQLDTLTQEDLAYFASASTESQGLVSAYLFTNATTQALLTAAVTHRSLIYVVAAQHGGAALKVPPSGMQHIESIELPDLTFSTVGNLLSRIQALTQDGRLQTRRQRTTYVDAILDDVGSAIWIPILEAWPSVRREPIAVLPVGETALLPLFTARAFGIPICAQADVTLTPSARALFLAEELVPTVNGSVLVVADPSPGLNPIPNTVDEAINVAAIHGTQALIIHPEGRADAYAPQSGHQREVAQRLASASLVHLACHGKLSGVDPLDSVLLVGNGIRLGQLLTQTLVAGSLMILSACELGGVGSGHPNEQMGFPGALLAAGARSVVGALWGVPDHPDTINFMVDYHQHLKTAPSNIALGHAIWMAQSAGVPSTVWGPFAHFGAISSLRTGMASSRSISSGGQ